MRKRRREVNIFSMSTIDLFACSLGAFVLLTLILLPYYLNIDRSYLDQIDALQATVATQESNIQSLSEKSEACSAELASVTTERDSVQAELQGARQSLDSIQSELNSVRSQAAAQVDSCSDIEQISFMLVLMSWESEDDVDLHVVDPDGRRYFYENRQISGSSAAFEEDNTRGPGNEVWLHPSATPGEYKVYFNFYRRRTNQNVRVRGTVFHQKGKISIPEVSLTEELGANFDRAALAITIVVDSNGNVSSR